MMQQRLPVSRKVITLERILSDSFLLMVVLSGKLESAWLHVSEIKQDAKG